jgi:hypothetical protein
MKSSTVFRNTTLYSLVSTDVSKETSKSARGAVLGLLLDFMALHYQKIVVLVVILVRATAESVLIFIFKEIAIHFIIL